MIVKKITSKLSKPKSLVAEDSRNPQTTGAEMGILRGQDQLAFYFNPINPLAYLLQIYRFQIS